MKKNYQKPVADVQFIHPATLICASVRVIDGGDLEFGGGGNGPARSRLFEEDEWIDE